MPLNKDNLVRLTEISTARAPDQATQTFHAEVWRSGDLIFKGREMTKLNMAQNLPFLTKSFPAPLYQVKVFMVERSEVTEGWIPEPEAESV